MATPHTPGRSQSSSAASKVSTTSPEHTARPALICSTQPADSAMVSSNTVLASPHGVLTGNALKSFPDSEYCGSRLESPPEWIISTRCVSHHSRASARSAPSARKA